MDRKWGDCREKERGLSLEEIRTMPLFMCVFWASEAIFWDFIMECVLLIILIWLCSLCWRCSTGSLCWMVWGLLLSPPYTHHHHTHDHTFTVIWVVRYGFCYFRPEHTCIHEWLNVFPFCTLRVFLKDEEYVLDVGIINIITFLFFIAYGVPLEKKAQMVPWSNNC